MISTFRVEAGGEAVGERGRPQTRRLQQTRHRHFLKLQGRNVQKSTNKKCDIFLRNPILFFSSTDSAPLLGPDHVFETMALEIEALLEKVPNHPAEELKMQQFIVTFNF
jgi:hypothetical protein